MEWPASSPDLNPIENLWDQLGRARVTNTTTLADLRQMLVEEWDAIPQVFDQHEEEVPGCCGYVWFFHTLLRRRFVK